MAKIEEEFEGQTRATNTKVIKEQEGFKLIQLPYGRHNIMDPDGSKLNDKVLTKEEAETFFNEVVVKLAKKPEDKTDE